MKLTESMLRKVIRQVVSESSNTPEAMINRYKSRPGDWNEDIQRQFIDMSKGGNGDILGYNHDVRRNFYSDWEDEDFERVVLAMKFVDLEPLIDEIMELSQEERDYIISKIS